MSELFLAVEDDLSEAVGRAVVNHVFGGDTYPQRLNVRGSGGFGKIQKNIGKYIELSRRRVVLIITDLDSRECAPIQRAEWLARYQVPERMSFRIAVREIEAWLLADRDNLARFFGISAASIPTNPEGIETPKERLISLARRASREIKADIVPSRNSNAIQGLGYNQRLSNFATDYWDVASAKVSSDSLNRTVRDLERVFQRGLHHA